MQSRPYDSRPPFPIDDSLSRCERTHKSPSPVELPANRTSRAPTIALNRREKEAVRDISESHKSSIASNLDTLRPKNQNCRLSAAKTGNLKTAFEPRGPCRSPKTGTSPSDGRAPPRRSRSATGNGDFSAGFRAAHPRRYPVHRKRGPQRVTSDRKQANAETRPKTGASTWIP